MKLENSMVIVANLGELKIFDVKKIENIVDNDLKISYNLEVYNDRDYISIHKRISEVLSDQSGNFKGSTAEEHTNNRKINKKRLTIKEISEDVNNIIKKKKPKRVFLALPKELSIEFMDYLESDIKNIIEKVINADLIKTDKNKILSHFE
ncbi:MAG: host attachment protein [Sulfurospirillum sp.]